MWLFSRRVTVHYRELLMDERSACAQPSGLNELCLHGFLTVCSLFHFLGRRQSVLDFSFKRTSNEAPSLLFLPFRLSGCTVPYLKEFAWKGGSGKPSASYILCECD